MLKFYHLRCVPTPLDWFQVATSYKQPMESLQFRSSLATAHLNLINMITFLHQYFKSEFCGLPILIVIVWSLHASLSGNIPLVTPASSHSPPTCTLG